MPDPHQSQQDPEGRENLLSEFKHPRGTLVIVTVFGVLFGLAWLAMYALEFLKRGAPHP